MDELYRARNALECLSVREGWPHFDLSHKKRIADVERRLRRINPARDLDGFMALNREFHLAMYEPCRNRHILRAVIALYDLSERYQRVALASADRIRQSGSQHGDMVKALDAADPAQLEALICAHNEGTEAAVRRHLGNGAAASSHE
jgi:DNA-binding GntR family transcriptional regulator